MGHIFLILFGILFLSMVGIETKGLLSSTVPANWCLIDKFIWLDFPLMEKQKSFVLSKIRTSKPLFFGKFINLN